MFSADVSQAMAGQVQVSPWIGPAALALVARLLARPALLTFYNPSRLTPLLKARVEVHASSSGVGSYGSYDAFQNTFIPFASGKLQFYAQLSLVRAASALMRSLHAFAETSDINVNAAALGDAVADMADVWTLSTRLGRSSRVMVASNLLAVLYYLRALLLDKPHDLRFGRLMQQCALSSAVPLWFFAATGMKSATWWGAVVSLLATVGFVLPRLAAYVRDTHSNEDQSESERADRRLNRIVAGVLMGFFGLKSVGLARVIFQ